MLNPQTFRDGMAKLAATVNVVTGHGPDGRTGCTVSAVCSVTDEPPTLLVCISRASRSNAAFKASGKLCVNVLSADQQPVAQGFADSRLGPEARFALAHWDTLTTGAPVLRHALATFDCEVTAHAELGTHTVFTCAVKAVKAGVTHGTDTSNGNASGDSLLYFERAYHRLSGAVGHSKGVAAA